MTRATGWGWLLWVALAAGCNESSPVDMWIGRDPDAGAGFEAPVREVGVQQTWTVGQRWRRRWHHRQCRRRRRAAARQRRL